MTLHTFVHLTGTISLEDAFALALRAVLTAEGADDRYDTVIIEREPAGAVDWDFIQTKPGQGLPTWTGATRRPDGSLFTPERDAITGDVIDDPEPWTVELSWDTSYTYTGTWPTASSLHGAALVHLHRSLPARTVKRFRWRDEFTHEWHNNLDGLADFVGEGYHAQAIASAALQNITPTRPDGRTI